MPDSELSRPKGMTVDDFLGGNFMDDSDEVCDSTKYSENAQESCRILSRLVLMRAQTRRGMTTTIYPTMGPSHQLMPWKVASFPLTRQESS